MADKIRRIDYYYATVPDKPGEAAHILTALHQAGINLLGVSAFPHGARRSQLDLIPEDSAAFAKAAKKAGLTFSNKKTGFLIQGEDRPGAIAETLSRLAQAGINVTSVQAACAGASRYGALLCPGSGLGCSGPGSFSGGGKNIVSRSFLSLPLPFNFSANAFQHSEQMSYRQGL